MRKKPMLFCGICSLLTALLCSGCVGAFVEHRPALEGQLSRSGHPVAYNITAKNTGFYLFYYVPIVGGDPLRANKHDFFWFTDVMRDRWFYPMLEIRKRRLKAEKCEDIEFREDCAGAFSLWLIWRRSRTAECVVTEKMRSPNEKEQKNSFF